MGLVFEHKLPYKNRAEIVDKIKSVSKNLGINPNWLMAVMNFESGLKTYAQNPYTNATGLIQFMPNTAIHLRTSVNALKQMSFINQLNYVERYYRPFKTKISSFVDLYLATFFPLALGKSDNWVVKSKNISSSLIARQNPVFDKFPKNNEITVGEIKKVLLSKIPADYLKSFATKNNFSILFGLFSLGIIMYNVFKVSKNV